MYRRASSSPGGSSVSSQANGSLSPLMVQVPRKSGGRITCHFSYTFTNWAMIATIPSKMPLMSPIFRLSASGETMAASSSGSAIGFSASAISCAVGVSFRQR